MRLLLLWPFAVSFRKNAENSAFIQIFSCFIHAGLGVDDSNLENLEHHRTLLSLDHLL